LNKVLKLLILFPAIFFIVTGVRWLVAPAGVAPMFGVTPGEGVGLSSQVGDMTGFFLTLGSCILIALVSARRTWYYPAIMLLAITALGRIVAWLVHDASLPMGLLAPEVIIALILFVASRRLTSSA
jgi:hypothetical protein